MRSHLAAFVIATAVAAVLTPLVRRYALSKGAVSGAGGRNVHQRSVPRLGGIAICLALFVPIVGMMFVESVVAGLFQAEAVKVLGLCGGGVVMCVTGVVDDTRGLRALYKLYVQLAVGVLAFFCGFRIDAVMLPFIGELSMGVFALPVTVFWIVGITNAVNLIDGLDGLAAGVVFFAGVTNFVVAYMAGQVMSALIMATVLGAVLGFLVYNFNPARIFMGDSGSYLLGYVLAVTALVGAAQKASTAVSLLVPIVALGVPIFDTLFAMVRRFLERRPLFSPDRGHIHHRLLDVGITHRRAVLILYAISIVFTVSAIAIYLGRSWQVGVALLVSSVVLVGLVRFVGVFSHTHLLKRQAARVRSRDTELLRWVMPDLPSRFSHCSTEAQVLDELTAIGEETGLVAIGVRVHGARERTVSWNDGVSDRRRVVATMRYPLGPDARARAVLEVAVVNDFEQEQMSPQTDILLQVLADIVATSLDRVGSGLGPKRFEQPASEHSALGPSPEGSSPEVSSRARASSPALAVEPR